MGDQPEEIPVQATAPVPTPVPTPVPPTNPASTPTPAPSRGVLSKLIFALISILFLVGGLGGGYTYAKSTIKPIDNTIKLPTIEVPSGATVISECAKGRGKQYIMPKDIPNGPVYNVLNNKVIGLEYMVGKDDLLVGSKNFTNLPMLSGVYDHINIGLLSTGHAGFPTPHYHVDVFLVPNSVAAAITCK